MTFHHDVITGIPVRLLLLLMIGATLTSCKNKDSQDPPDPPPEDLGKASVWLTKGDQTALLSKTGDLPIKETASPNWPVLVIDTTSVFQSMEGFGAALTGSSAYLIDEKMDAATRQNTLQKLFDPELGIGISYLRLTMGASDFSLSNFSYDDIPSGETDFTLEHFSLSRDLEDVVPVLKEVIQIAPEIELMGSPWSPPAWMKTSGSMVGGKLKPECYPVYADYFVRYIQAMAAEGITITAITPQNEPLYSTASYPCMDMPAVDQLEFIKSHLGPKFVQAGITAKIIIYDHNWDVPGYPITILNDPDARQYIAGSAFHAYGGDVSAMSTVHNAHPDKDLYFTEISGGGWATDFSDNLMWATRNIFIGTAMNWSRSALMWNLVLDQFDGPQNNGCGNCRGVVTLNTASGQIIYNEEYYTIGHFSKFVRPGAMRIGMNIPYTLTSFEAIAFLNPDGSKVLVACNFSEEVRIFTVEQDIKHFSYTLPSKSVVTITWE